MKKLNFISYLLSFVITAVISIGLFNCRDKGIEIINRNIYLTADDIGVIDVWLKIKVVNSDQDSVSFQLQRDGQTILTFNASSFFRDTIILDNNLLPKHVYTYKTFKVINSQAVDSSSSLIVTTMDTTSHYFTWEFDTLGGIQSRVNGLWGTDEENVYAVGYFNTNSDMPTNLARWNGDKWNYLRPEVISGWWGIQSGELENVFGLSKDKIWVVGYGWGSIGGMSPDTVWGFVAEWDGKDWKNISPSAVGEYFVSVWASSENDLYVTTAGGCVYHRTNEVWEKLTTNTDYYLSDVWGFSNKEIYISGHPLDYSTGIVLKYNGVNFDRVNILPENSIVSFKSIWGTSERFMFVASDGGLFSKINTQWKEVIYPGNRVALLKVRGYSKNNVLVCGPFSKIIHYNGCSWESYEQQFSGYEYLKAIQVFNKIVFIGGTTGEGFNRKGLVLRGRR